MRQEIEDEFWFRLLARVRGQPTEPWDEIWGPWDAEDDEILEGMLAEGDAQLDGRKPKVISDSPAKADDPIFREPWTVSGVWKPPPTYAPEDAVAKNRRIIAAAAEELLQEPGKRGSWWATINPRGSETPWVQVKLHSGGVVNFWYPFDDEAKRRLEEGGLTWPTHAAVVSEKKGLYCTVAFPGHELPVLITFATELFGKLYGVPDADLVSGITKPRRRAKRPSR